MSDWMWTSYVDNRDNIYGGIKEDPYGYIGIDQILLGVDWIYTAYGTQSQVSKYPPPGSIIRAEDWNLLVDDLQRIYVHLHNKAYDIDPVLTGQLVTADYVNQIVDMINALGPEDIAARPQTAEGTYPSEQTTSQSVESSRTDSWGSTITHEAVFEWAGEDIPMWRFLYLGGVIIPRIEYTPGSESSDPYDQRWKDMIDAANAQGLLNVDINAVTMFFLGPYVLYQSSETDTNRLVITAEYSDETYSGIRVKAQFITQGTNLSINVKSSFECEYSVIRTDMPIYHAGKAYYGFAAPAPRITVTSVLPTGGEIPPPIEATSRILSVTPSSLTFGVDEPFVSGTTSIVKTVTLYNKGTNNLSITSISVASADNITGIFTGVPNGTIIAPGTNVTLNVSFSASQNATLGDTARNIVIKSTNDSGDVNIPVLTKVTAAVPTFDFNLIPSIWNLDIISTTPVSQKFTIDVLSGGYTSYTASLGGSNPGDFTIDNSGADGPVVRFDPGVKAVGAYNATVSVTATPSVGSPVTHVSTIAMNIQALPTEPLGNWISAAAPDNSIVGISYDRINGTKYLTIGVGLGSDQSTWLSNGSGYADVANLGVAADPYFDRGPVLYYSIPYSGWIPFLKPQSVEPAEGYGAWVRPSNYIESPTSYGGPKGPNNIPVVRTYRFNTVTGAYNWKFACDNWGTLSIDDIVVTPQGGVGFNTLVSGSVNLSAGEHTVTFTVAGGGNASVAARIYDSTGADVWSTRTPIRPSNSTPYAFWNEVYRIPLTQVGKYYTANHVIKDHSSYFADQWQALFGTWGTNAQRSMFTVELKSNGDVTVTANELNSREWYNWPYYSSSPFVPDLTTMMAPYALYYYIPYIHFMWWKPGNPGEGNAYDLTDYYAFRYNPNGLQGPGDAGYPGAGLTRVFLGFSESGAVQTGVVAIPPTEYPQQPNPPGWFPATGGQGG